MEPSKFYSYTLFDMSSTGSTPTGKRTPFTNSTDANNWDANLALTETNLVDVTTDNNGVKTCIAASTCLSTSTTGQNNVLGWFIRHVNTVTGQTSLPGDEKTSASALVLGGCALWQTLLPTSVQETCEGLTLPADNGFAYQSDVALGTVACGASGGSTVTSAYRSVRSDTIVAPQEATPVVSINAATHQTMISGISLPVGAQPIQVNLGVGLPQGTVHWLELTPAQHGCRHNGTGCTQ